METSHGFGLRAILFYGMNALLYRVGAAENQISDAVHRQIRALTYPEDSEMGLFFALAIPLDDPISTKSVSMAFFFEATYKLPNDDTDFIPNYSHGERRRRSIDRTAIYSVLESKFEAIGFPGRQCLLRSICETVRHPVHLHNGVLGDLVRIVLTPSSSSAEGLPEEYDRAERVDGDVECASEYPLCPIGIYDYISDVYQ